MTMTFLERVARAVTPDWYRLSRNDRRNALITVRETLRAAREPSEMMRERGGSGDWYLGGPADVWRTMIDAAIADAPEGFSL